ncbi:MAG: PQQ-binding-like beta-propeller repeat protein [Planctomycetes bacterium]|nr:PQQ-binding-like beta-propeller repeat protein [Planctomycetota bacterium]
MKSFIALSVMLHGLAVTPGLLSQERADNWPAFRGLNASGVSHSVTPVKWDLDDSTNVKWKLPIPGLAHSCPVVWGDRLFVTTATTREGNTDVKTGLYGDIGSIENEVSHEWLLYCVDKETGTVLWQKVAHIGTPKAKRHPKSSHANSTPVTDGKHVVAFYGSEGLYCYDMEGRLLWEKDFGVLNASYYRAPKAQWGFGSSPIIHEGTLLVQVDVLENSFLGAFNIADGMELWRTPRSDVPTWCSPSIYSVDGVTRIAINGYRHIGGYDFGTGKEIWSMREGGDIPVPTPVIGEKLMFFTSAHGKLRPIYAVRTSAQGDITLSDGEQSNASVAWSLRRSGAYMPTPILIGDYLYRLQGKGSFSCFDRKSGEQIYDHRLKAPGAFIASPIASKNALYCCGEKGDVFVIKPGKAFEVLAVNSLKDNCLATPAISEGVIYFRTQHNLIAISEE